MFLVVLFPHWHLEAEHAHDFCLAAFSTLPLFGLAYLIQNRTQIGNLEDIDSDHPPRLEGRFAAHRSNVAGARRRRRLNTVDTKRKRASDLSHLIIFFAAFSIATTLAAIGGLLQPPTEFLAAVLISYSLTAFLLFSRVGSLSAMIIMELLPQPTAGRQANGEPTTWRYLYELHPLRAVVTLPGPILTELFRSRRSADRTRWIGSALVLALLWSLVILFTLFMAWVSLQMILRTSVTG